VNPLVRHAEDLSWLINNFVERVPSVAHAMVVSSDGLPIAHSQGFPEARVDQFAAITSGLLSLTQGASRVFEGGTVTQTIVEMQRGLLIVMSVSDASSLAVLAAADCDLGLVAYEMALLVERVGGALTPEMRHAQPTDLPDEGTLSAADHSVAGRDVNIGANQGSVAAGVIHGDVRSSRGVQVGDHGAQRNIFGSGPPGEVANTGGDGPTPKRRYLKGECPDSIPVGEPFSLLVSIVLGGPANARLKPFDVPPEGRDVLLVVHTPGMRLLGRQRLAVRVPPDGDSEPVMFELRAEAPGPRRVSVTAWIDGSYLGELLVEITAERNRPPGPHRDVYAEIATESIQGAVSLVVRYDPAQNAYRFEFRDEDNPDEVTSNLAYDPGPLVEHLVGDLDDLAKGRSGYSAGQTRDYLVNAGARLWNQLVPAQLREQFWDRQHRIRQLTILADKDAVPWELLYPMDPGRDAGFLVEQFPVTRAVFGRRPTRKLSLRPAWFVLPEGSPPRARDEVDSMLRLLNLGQPPSEVISALTPLQDLIANGNFGLLHFACHNTYNPSDGSSIQLGKVQFTPTLMTTAAINKVLQRSTPTIFINACRSAGLNATYNQLDGWARKFLEAGAGAFIGSLWSVSDGRAREFAQEFYGQLQAGFPLGKAVMQARQLAATQLDDPTWLAYTVYGDSRASISQQQP
jgi:predicted regulator of Ras-like GTPase activity (Roadblock/LC7/MglB family)